MPPVCKRTRSAAVKHPTSSQAVIQSNKRVVQKPSKYKSSIERLRPAKYRYGMEARKLLEVVTSTAFRKKHSESVLFCYVFCDLIFV